MVHAINKRTMWLFTFSITQATKHLQFPTKQNTTYKTPHPIHALTHLSLKNNYANNGLKKLQKTHKQTNPQKQKHKKNKKPIPDSDTFLYRIKQIPKNTLKKMTTNLNHAILEKAKQKGAFKKTVTLAIDLTCLPYYGKLTHKTNGSKPKQGTNYFHTWATLRIVTPGRRFTLSALPIKRGNLDAAAMAKTLTQLLETVKKLDLKVDLILLDKGFCWKEILDELNKSDYKYLIAAKKDKAVKEAILDYIKTKKGRVRPFSKGKGTGQVEFNLTIHRFRKTKPKLKNILELYGAFATNMEFKEAVKVWSKLPELYKRRWGIETGYRVDGGFRALTTSRNSKVRYLYYLYMVFLGNVWVLGNFLACLRDGGESARRRGVWVCVGEFCLDFVYLGVVWVVDRGPPGFCAVKV